MFVERLAAPRGTVLTLAEAKLWLRVDTPEEDALIPEIVAAAVARFEELTGRQVLAAGFRAKLPRFPADGEPLRLPRPPLAGVDRIVYHAGGHLLTLAATEYRLVKPAGEYPQRGAVVASADRWPRTDPEDDAVTVEFTAGSAEPTAGVKQAVRHLAAAMYENRGHAVGPRGFDMGAEALVEPYILADVSLGP